MNHILLTCNQSPMHFTRPILRKYLRPLFYLYGGITVALFIGGFFESMLFFLAGLFGIILLLLINWQRMVLQKSNTVEFYEDTLLLRNHRGEVIRTVCYKDVLYADVIPLRFAGKQHRSPAYRAQGRYLCLWLAETPPLWEDDSFVELNRWEELFLLAYNEDAERLLREKARFQS